MYNGLGQGIVAYRVPRRLDPALEQAARALRAETWTPGQEYQVRALEPTARSIAPLPARPDFPLLEELERARPTAPAPPPARAAGPDLAKWLPLAALGALAYFVM